MSETQVGRVVTSADRDAARMVFDSVYVREKRWSAPGDDPFAPADDVSWFLARVSGEPAGLLRLRYDPPVIVPPGYDVVLRDDIDWAGLVGRARVVDIGRFMITVPHRKRPRVALRLMGAAMRELVMRGYTHLVTDVFEGERHSPLDFHVRVLGFEVIGWHDHGELAEDRRRIVLLLDIDRAYRTFRERSRPLTDMIIGDVRHELEARRERAAAELTRAAS